MKSITSKYEKELLGRGYKCVAGIDEAGRGSWAGPVVAACVAFDTIRNDKGFVINDSKKLIAKMRDKSYEWLIENFDYGVGVVSHELIDRIGIVPATKLAMEQAVNGMKHKPDYLLIDAVKLPQIKIKQESIIKGDSKVWCIAAASIIAKVTRDRIMTKYHATFPEYNFDKHKGYGTKRHHEMMCAHGICRIHRRSYKPIQPFI